ncbi:hypothetical protein U1Q18_007096 [Sarracenia purpurea var. burkii]
MVSASRVPFDFAIIEARLCPMFRLALASLAATSYRVSAACLAFFSCCDLLVGHVCLILLVGAACWVLSQLLVGCCGDLLLVLEVWLARLEWSVCPSLCIYIPR